MNVFCVIGGEVPLLSLKGKRRTLHSRELSGLHDFLPADSFYFIIFEGEWGRECFEGLRDWVECTW